MAGLITVSLQGAGQARAGTQDLTLILSFRLFCGSERPDYARLDHQATEAGLQLLQKRDVPRPDGSYLHQKMWLVTQEGGQHAVISLETNGPAGYLTACGIASPDLNTEEFKAALAASFKLARPTSEKVAPGTAIRTTRWDGVFGPGTVLQLSQGTGAASLDYGILGPRRR